LVIHTVLMGVFFLSVPSFLRSYVNSRDIAMAGFPLILAIVFATSVRLNWLLLKNQRWAITPPGTSFVQLVLVILSPTIIYFASGLGFSYDDHLSIYSLYIELPFRLWVPKAIDEFRVGITATAEGIRMFIFCVFSVMLLVTIHTLGLLSNTLVAPGFPIGRAFIFNQILAGLILLAPTLFVFYHYILHLIWFVHEVALDRGLLNAWNLGRLLFQFINIALLLWYAIWVVADSIYLWKINKTAKAVA
jgi:hypothetical protein